MRAVLLDTHTFIWSLVMSSELSATARDQLLPLWREQGTELAPYTAEIAFLAGALQWSHRDPFDRMIAATALALACPLISKDGAFDRLAGFPGWQGRIWDAASLPSPV